MYIYIYEHSCQMDLVDAAGKLKTCYMGGSRRCPFSSSVEAVVLSMLCLATHADIARLALVASLAVYFRCHSFYFYASPPSRSNLRR